VKPHVSQALSEELARCATCPGLRASLDLVDDERVDELQVQPLIGSMVDEYQALERRIESAYAGLSQEDPALLEEWAATVHAGIENTLSALQEEGDLAYEPSVVFLPEEELAAVYARSLSDPYYSDDPQALARSASLVALLQGAPAPDPRVVTAAAKDAYEARESRKERLRESLYARMTGDDPVELAEAWLAALPRRTR
jgi:hypothetical protein